MIGIVVRNTLVTYDRENSKIGFWKTNCSELWERLHESVSPPAMPPASGHKNSTPGVTPTLAPTGAPPYVLPGSIPSLSFHWHGCLIFYLSLKLSVISYSSYSCVGLLIQLLKCKNGDKSEANRGK